MSKGPGGSVAPAHLAASVVSKLCISPLCAMVMVFISVQLGFVNNQEMGLVLVVMASTPSAITLITLVSISGKSEEQISAVLFYQYLLAMVSLPACLILYQTIAPAMFV